MKKLQDRINGFVTLISVIVISVIGLSVALALISSSTDTSLTSLDIQRSGQGRAYVDACLEEGLQQIRDDTSYIGTGSMDFQYGGCEFEVTSQGGESRTVRASSTIALIIRKAEVVIDAINPLLNVVSWTESADFGVFALGDTTSPAQITDLATSAATSNSIDLDWTAPGDDDVTGTATTYDVRYSTSLITAGNWGSATQASGEPSPSVAGSSESMTVVGLDPSTTYYFAIKTSDEVPNESILSNVPSLSTTGGITTCAEYCQSQAYSTGTCRANTTQCTNNGETYESAGDPYCPGGGGSDTCCCAP